MPQWLKVQETCRSTKHSIETLLQGDEVGTMKGPVPLLERYNRENRALQNLNPDHPVASKF